MTEPTNAEIRKYLDKYSYTSGFPSDMAKVILDRLEVAEGEISQLTFLRDQNLIRARKAEAKLHSIDEFLGELIGEGESDFADRLARAMKGHDKTP